MKPFTRVSAIGVPLLVLGLALVALAQGANWITGDFMVVAHKGRQWVGGTKQTVYSGPDARTYRFTSPTDPSGLWVVSDGAATPIPTSPKAIEASGKRVEIELRTENRAMISTGEWIDLPQHNVTCGAAGVVLVKVKGTGTTQIVYNGSTNRVFRFTSPDDPTGLWVRMDSGAELPIPTSRTAIDIGGKSLTLVVKTDANRTACWQDVTN